MKQAILVMQTINQRQNTEEALAYLYCQRFKYDQAKCFGIIIFSLAIFSTLLLFFPVWFNETPPTLFTTCSVTIVIINSFLFFFKRKLQEDGADYQQLFDYYVFEFKQNTYEELKNIPEDDIIVSCRNKKLIEINKKHLNVESFKNWGSVRNYAHICFSIDYETKRCF